MFRINFEIPNYQVSGLRVKGLAVDVADKNYNAYESFVVFILVIVISVISLSPRVIVADYKVYIAFCLLNGTMSGVNLFWYGSDDDGEQIQSEKVTTETNVADDQKKNEIETEKKVEDNTQKEEKTSKPGNDLKETKEKEIKKETKVSEPKKEVISTSTQSNAKSVDNDPSHWMAVVDPNTNRTYYWNQVCSFVFESLRRFRM